MRRTLRLLLLLGIGLLMAKDKDGIDLTGKSQENPERDKRLDFQGRNASEKMAEVHDIGDAASKDGRAPGQDAGGNSETDVQNDKSDADESTDSDSTVPDHASETLDYIRENGTAPPGYGLPKWQEKKRPFQNRDEDLPTEDGDGDPITYTEFDVHPYTPGVNRGGERIVIGSDGRAWYTDDHYHNFTLVEE